MKKYINKYSISFFVMFLIMMLSISCLTSVNYFVLTDMAIDNFLLSQEATLISVENTKISQKDLNNIICNNENIIVTKRNIYSDSGNSMGITTYFNYELDIQYPMLEGEFFTKEECKNKELVAVVGKNMVNETYVKDGKRYINVESKEYLVKGIIGIERRNLKTDNMFIVNGSAYFEDYRNLSQRSTFVFSSQSDTNKAYQEIVNKIKKIDENAKVSKLGANAIGKTTTFIIQELPDILTNIILFFLTNMVIVNFFWLDSRKKELGIKKSLGASNNRMFFSILIQQQIMIVLAYVISLAIHYIIVTYTQWSLLDYIGTQIYIGATLKTLLYGMIIGLLINIPFLINVNKIEPSLSMKGRV